MMPGDLQPEPGQRHDADDDAGSGGRAPTPSTPIAPVSSAASEPRAASARFRAAGSSDQSASIVAQNTARNADMPETMKTAIATSDVK